MELGESLRLSPYEQVEKFGASLVSDRWTIGEATTQLAANMITLGCSADVLTEDFRKLDSLDADETLNPGTPVFKDIIRLTTRGIIFLDNLDNEADFRQANYLLDLSLDPLMSENTEQPWVHVEEKQWLAQSTTRSADLLKSFLKGLGCAGFPKDIVKGLMRDEIESNLDILAEQSAHNSIYVMNILSRTMSKAHLNNFHTGLHLTRIFKTRFKYLWGEDTQVF